MKSDLMSVVEKGANDFLEALAEDPNEDKIEMLTNQELTAMLCVLIEALNRALTKMGVTWERAEPGKLRL